MSLLLMRPIITQGQKQEHGMNIGENLNFSATVR
jgi:hypothetical protein